MRPLRVMLDRFDNGKAIFLTQEGQQLVWDRYDLPEDIQEGKIYFVHFSNEAEPVVTAEKDTTTQEKTSVPTEKTAAKPIVSEIAPEPAPLPDPQADERRKLARTILEEILNGSTPS